MNDWSPKDLKALIEEEKFVFLKLWKKGCGACKLSKPALERIVAMPEFSKVEFGQISTDDHPEILEISESDVLPSFFMFGQKKMLGKHIGFKGQQKLQSFVEESIQA